MRGVSASRFPAGACLYEADGSLSPLERAIFDDNKLAKDDALDAAQCRSVTDELRGLIARIPNDTPARDATRLQDGHSRVTRPGASCAPMTAPAPAPRTSERRGRGVSERG